MTLDGRIAKDHNHFTNWTSPEDKTFMRALLARCDVIVVGHNTYKTAQKPLSKRNCIVLTRSVNEPKRSLPNLLFCNPEKTNLAGLISSLGHHRVAVLGGTQTYTYFLKHNLLDDLYLTIEPVVFGTGLPLFEGTFNIRRLRLVSTRKLNTTGTLLLHYSTVIASGAKQSLK